MITQDNLDAARHRLITASNSLAVVLKHPDMFLLLDHHLTLFESLRRNIVSTLAGDESSSLTACSRMERLVLMSWSGSDVIAIALRGIHHPDTVRVLDEIREELLVNQTLYGS